MPAARLIIASLLLLRIAVAEAADPPCPAFDPPAVSVRRVFDEPGLDISRSLRALRELAARSGERHSDTQTPLGHARAVIVSDLEINVQLAGYTTRPPVVCGALAQVTVVMGFRETEIVIAREAAADACVYAEVLAHERRHVEVDRAILAAHAPRIQARIAEAARQIGTVRAGTPQAVSDTLMRRLQTALQPGLAEMRADRTRRQRAIDTPQETARVSESCGGAVQRMLRTVLPQSRR